MRLIDADAYQAFLYRRNFDGLLSESMLALNNWLLSNAPTIDAVPVKHGEWIWDDEGYHCSDCFFHAYGNTLECLDGTYRYCPNCGAKMDGRKDDE